jgi:hypothetical protein
MLVSARKRCLCSRPSDARNHQCDGGVGPRCRWPRPLEPTTTACEAHELLRFGSRLVQPRTLSYPLPGAGCVPPLRTRSRPHRGLRVAPGPMGWRYFAHVHPAEDPDRDEFTVDVVTDLDWKLARFRLAAGRWMADDRHPDCDRDGKSCTNDRAPTGPSLFDGPSASDGPSVVWSSSPWTRSWPIGSWETRRGPSRWWGSKRANRRRAAASR